MSETMVRPAVQLTAQVQYAKSDTVVCPPCTDMSVEDEDKPEQQLAKLAEVAEAAPIKHEGHASDANQPTQHQLQQLDTVQVRMPAAGAAEVDPLQNGHPADLDPPAAPAPASAPPAGSGSVSAGVWDLAQSSNCPQRPQHQLVNGTTQYLTDCAGRLETDHRHRGVSPKVPGLPTSGADPFTGVEKLGDGGGLAQVKDEAVLQAGMGFQTGDTAMAGEENADIGVYVKAEEALLRQASGSSGSENGQAVLMDLDVQGRQPSPAALANSASLGEQPHACGQQCCCRQLHTLCRQTCCRLLEIAIPAVKLHQEWLACAPVLSA